MTVSLPSFTMHGWTIHVLIDFHQQVDHLPSEPNMHKFVHIRLHEDAGHVKYRNIRVKKATY
jgi:hypothetical protein